MTEPKYRYFLVPPPAISLPLGDIVPALPAGSWSGSERDKGRAILLPAAETLAANAPRIRFARLRELAPDCIREISDAPEWIALPAAPLVLAYRPGVRREEIPEEKPAPAPPAEPAPAPPADKEKPATPPAPAEEKKPEEPEPSKDVPAESPEPTPPEPASAPKPLPAWKRLLKPKLAPPPPEAAPKDDPSPAASAPAVPLPLVDRAPAAEDEQKLRALFMTEDPLTIGTLVDLCAKLPGVAGCELHADPDVVRSASMPKTLKPADWIAPARDALAKMPGIPAKMPCITLHPPSAAVSMWLPAKFSLVVVHDERGFRPGVLEKIDATVAAIGRAIGEGAA